MRRPVNAVMGVARMVPLAEFRSFAAAEPGRARPVHPCPRCMIFSRPSPVAKTFRDGEDDGSPRRRAIIIHTPPHYEAASPSSGSCGWERWLARWPRIPIGRGRVSPVGLATVANAAPVAPPHKEEDDDREPARRALTEA